MSSRPKIIHLAEAAPDPRIWTAVFVHALREIADLEIVADAGKLSSGDRAALLRSADVAITAWGAARCPDELAEDFGRLRYICNVTGELARFLPLSFVERGLLVSNWGDYPAIGVAEGAIALLLATLKDMHAQIQHVRRNGWKMDMHFHGGSLYGATVGIYGLGVIGRRFVDLIRPYGAHLRVFDPFVTRMPAGCERADTLEQLFDGAQIIVIHAALTEATRHSVTAELLAKLPRHGVVINTARGGIIDQPALFRELESGRLRAGLDVLDPDELADNHPARGWENLILTAHRVDHGWPDFNEEPKALNRMQEICLDNLRTFFDGGTPRFLFDVERYKRST